MCNITDRMKDGLITYMSFYNVYEELNNTNLQLSPLDNPEAFLELHSLNKYLKVVITIKITELINSFVS